LNIAKYLRQLFHNLCMLNYDEDQEVDLNELFTEQDDHFDGNEFGFLDRKKIRNVFIAS
jgi:hypothetical protein